MSFFLSRREKTQGKRRRSLKTQLLGFVIGITVAIIVLLIGVATYYVSKSAEDSLEKSMQVTADLAAQSVTEKVDSFGSIAKFIFATYRDNSFNRSSFQQYLQNKEDEGLLQGYDVLNAKGSSMLTGKSLSSHVAVQGAVSAPFLSNAIVEGDAVYFEYAYPIENFIVLLDIPYEAIGDMVSSIKIGDTGDCYIMDTDGNKVAHSNIENVIAGQENNSFVNYEKDPKAYESLVKAEKAMAAGERGFMYFSWEGTQKFISFSPISGTNGWSLAVTAAKSEFTSQVIWSILTILVLGVILIVLTAVITGRIVARIMRPVREIEDAVRKLAAGDLSADVTYTSQDELGSLSNSIRTLLRNLTGYIQDISQVLGHISAGDMTTAPKLEYEGDFAPIKASLENILSTMDRMLSHIRQAAEQVSAGATQMAGGAQSLSAGATEQASSVEELSAVMTEISHSTRANAETTQTAQQNADAAGSQVEASNTQMAQVTEAMEQITQSSQEIGRIISTIESIAFQTNILALNAAIEAARAGTAGKGFAVVADEVRNLAAKSDEAAKATKELIEKSIHSVDNGSRLVSEVSDSLKTSTEMVLKAVDGMNTVSHAVKTEAENIEQILEGIEQISGVVQNNSATAEESAAVSEELSSQAELLKQLIDRFILRGDKPVETVSICDPEEVSACDSEPEFEQALEETPHEEETLPEEKYEYLDQA